MFFKRVNVMVLLFGLGFAQSILAAPAKQYIELYMGQVKTIQVGEVKRIAVGMDTVLGASVMDNDELLLIPKAPGSTELHIWKAGERKLTLTVDVLPAQASKTLKELRSVFRTFEHVSFRHESGFILAEGKIRPEDATLFQGTLEKFPEVISMVRAEQVEIKDMVKMQVKVLEINKNDGLQFGINWDNAISGPSLALVTNFKPNDYYVFGSDDNELLGLFDGKIPISSSKSYSYGGIATGINSIINLLKEQGTARILAEPSLSTRSGEKASFQSGGSYPLAVLNEFGQPVVEMQDYGIQLDIQPIIDEQGNIVSTVRAEMSSIDFSTVVQGVPGLLTRNTESVVNMRAGETLVISGLIKVEDSRSYEKLPLLGDIPILGELFTSRNFQQGRSELIILVTPTVTKVDVPLSDDIQQNLTDMEGTAVDVPTSDWLLD
ncbi:pilus assembly protein N-terminal domain-containing protein [Shewanella sp. C32]|uniref:Pilus assembly protein N-terminal domain-containing protein n=1 Tax=Shewanella electrica TaxID=515560 RepID=A0ABT2FPE3_9GAMM|nr:pilus assembly protein N-terminal domain-containing protein [Shewanella electrica]MCH1926566.1 pilus assembly protein N-terminal domain-containing protein [Shewanella electrica]MCS4558187.1 pilus assembly protein N-terminal domain-containing protein [Shewanella electrica]